MKISYNWLKSLGNFSHEPFEVSAMLTDCGLEVEGVEVFETIPGALKGVVIGEIVTCQKHPQADRLWTTTVKVNDNSILKIVCGAPNAKAGQKVFVATVGAVLQTPKGTLEIKKANIRGEESEGMICAEDELGLGQSHDGIMVLPPDAPVGTEAAVYLGYQTDQIFEIGLTPNRIDAASHFGVARDLAAVINHHSRSREVKLNLPSVEAFSVDNNNLPIGITIEDAEKCPRYAGLTISGVQIADSPAWLRNMLKSIGIRPVNNVVDITNYVLHEVGQPLHAFDADRIDGRKVVVRCPDRGHMFTTLDGKEISLTGEDLMICNSSGPMCIGGVLGGINSGVTNSTQNIFLESAYFHPVSIRKTAKFHGIRTDASFRFERGADPQMVIYALKRAAFLIKEIAGGNISSDIVDVYPKAIQPAIVEFSLSRASEIIGMKIPFNEVKSILESLDILILNQPDADLLLLSIPTYRVDVTREVDVIEEILRIYGYNNIIIPERLHSTIVLSPKPDREKIQNAISDLLAARGFFEVMNNSLSYRSYYQLPGYNPAASVDILNPINQDLNVMRQNLLFGGLENIAYNQNRKAGGLKIFEFGKVYSRNPGHKGEGHNPLNEFSENTHVCLFVAGPKQTETWVAKEEPYNFFDLKAELMQVLIKMGVQIRQMVTDENDDTYTFDYGMRFLVNGVEIANAGKVGKAVLKVFDIKQEVYFAQILWEKLIRIHHDNTLLYTEVPKFPEVRRDLSLLLDKHIRFADIEALAYKAENQMLKGVRLFDVYQDKLMGENKKSYAISFTLLDPNATLTDAEIDGVMSKIQQLLTKELGAEIR